MTRSVNRRFWFLAVLAASLLAAPVLAQPSLKDYGGACDGQTDNSPALNAAIAAWQSGALASNVLALPRGQCVFKSPPAHMPPLRVVGETKLATVVRKQFDGGVVFNFDGARGTGGGLERMAIYADAGFAPGVAISLSGNESLQPDETVFSELYVTGPGLWTIGLFADGLVRTTPQGLREVKVDHSEFFNATVATLWLRNVVGFEMWGGGVFPGAGPTGAGGIWVNGGGSPLTNSTDVELIGVNNNGLLDVTNTLGLTVLGGAVGQLAADTTSHFRVETLNLNRSQ